MNPLTRRNIKKIFPFGLIWALYGLIYTLLEKGILGTSTIYPSTGNPYIFTENLLITPLFSLFIGWTFGTIEVLFLGQLFNRRSLFQKILLKTIIYTLCICISLVLMTFVVNSIGLNKAIFDPEVVSSVFTFVFTFAFLSVSIYVGSIMGLSLFIHDISDNLGLHVVKNFFTGKYHSPKEENRIFMFLDMQSSTSIAEQLGHVVYFRFLKTYYKDIAHSIIRTSGEIYQYVGDEIIVSWTTKKGLHRNNCIRCFFLIKQTMEKLAPIYAEQYGIVPGFKAGIHFGPVTTGEIGRIKKEIVFSGDVLNTTARIQGLCNKFEVDNLISGELNALLNIDDEYEISSKGKSNLRGRNTSVELFSLSKK